MSRIHSLLALASAPATTSHLTTTLPVPDSLDPTITLGFIASIISVKDSTTTMAIVPDSDTLQLTVGNGGHYLNITTTVTLAGTTSLAWNFPPPTISPGSFHDPGGITYAFTCSIDPSNAGYAVCTQAERGTRTSAGGHESLGFMPSLVFQKVRC